MIRSVNVHRNVLSTHEGCSSDSVYTVTSVNVRRKCAVEWRMKFDVFVSRSIECYDDLVFSCMISFFQCPETSYLKIHHFRVKIGHTCDPIPSHTLPSWSTSDHCKTWCISVLRRWETGRTGYINKRWDGTYKQEMDMSQHDNYETHIYLLN